MKKMPITKAGRSQFLYLYMARWLILTFVFCAAMVNAQNHQKKSKRFKSIPTSKDYTIQLGAGASNSVIYLNRNVKEQNDALGLQTSAVFYGPSQFRYALEYTRYRQINIAPTWYDIKAYSIEANFQLMFKVKEGDAFFYPQFGLSYNVFSGYFTGTQDFMNLALLYPIQSTVVNRWIGLNTGVGYERCFDRFSIFLDYKMRTGFTESKKLNIMDVCISGGMRYRVYAGPLRKLFKGTRSRYLLKTSGKK